MKPSKNNVFCPECGKTKMLFESEAKALNFIKFNKDEMEAEGRYVPRRAYWCACCAGYHLTSRMYHTDSIASTGAVVEQYREERRRMLEAKKRDMKGVRLLDSIHSILRDKGNTLSQEELNRLAELYQENKDMGNAKKLKKRIEALLRQYGVGNS